MSGLRPRYGAPWQQAPERAPEAGAAPTGGAPAEGFPDHMVCYGGAGTFGTALKHSGTVSGSDPSARTWPYCGSFSGRIWAAAPLQMGSCSACDVPGVFVMCGHILYLCREGAYQDENARAHSDACWNGVVSAGTWYVSAHVVMSRHIVICAGTIWFGAGPPERIMSVCILKCL